MDVFFLSIAGVRIRVDSHCPTATRWLEYLYQSMMGPPGEFHLRYHIRRRPGGTLQCVRHGQRFVACSKAEFVYEFEKALTISLERLRYELLFLHAAVVIREGHAHIICGASGSGKSTTTWALLRHGFGYASDELAPIDLARMRVLAYPHALCLKWRPPPPYSLPASSLETERTIHVAIPHSHGLNGALRAPLPVGSIGFLQNSADEPAPSIRRIPASEAAVRLYTNTLNALAHGNDGLNAVVTLASRCDHLYIINRGGLPETCELLADFTSNLATAADRRVSQAPGFEPPGAGPQRRSTG
ncbi:hypothetical protein [Arhodomonas sp. AD133]|uniref:hypothetical protein n=1 Tax=Arhodomonas sp. AD133 TaxID=3415009 RepID=UPI003EBB9D16